MRKFTKEYTPSGKFNIVNFPSISKQKDSSLPIMFNSALRKKMTGSYCYTIYAIPSLVTFVVVNFTLRMPAVYRSTSASINVN